MFVVDKAGICVDDHKLVIMVLGNEGRTMMVYKYTLGTFPFFYGYGEIFCYFRKFWKMNKNEY